MSSLSKIIMKKVIAITGPIGSGKSTLIKLLQNDFVTFSIDQIQNDLYAKDKALYKLLQKSYPEFIINQKVQKHSIKEKLIKDSDFKNKYQNDVIEILTSHIKDLIKNIDNIIFIEIPYINSSNLSSLFDKIIVIESKIDIRLNRIIKRDNINKQKALNWLNASVKNISFNNYKTIYNNDSLAKLKEQLKEVLKWITL